MLVTTAALDAKIPFLELALNPQQVQAQLQQVLPTLRQVLSATLIRHKLARRALIEYHIETTTGPITLLGKIRAKGTDWATYQLQQSLWHQGFAADSSDGYSVPEPIGVLPDWQMWLQQKVPGVPVTELLPTSAGMVLAGRIARLAHKLHQTPISTAKTHTLADELQILHERLPQVGHHKPSWQRQIQRILSTCDALAASHPCTGASPTGIHRDFYSDQVLVDGNRLWLVDLDLYCQGHPALDIGNFIAHITEQSLRQAGDPTLMADREEALRETFIQASAVSQTTCVWKTADALRSAIALYTLLTLVRHIDISHRMPERQPYTGMILELCEDQLGQMRQG